MFIINAYIDLEEQLESSQVRTTVLYLTGFYPPDNLCLSGVEVQLIGKVLHIHCKE